MFVFRIAALVAACLTVAWQPAMAQGAGHEHDAAPAGGHEMAGMDMPMPAPMATPLGVGDGRDGSATSWLPDVTPMSGLMRHAGAWMVMVHGQLFLQEIDVSGARGDRQLGAVNWLMASARRRAAGGALTARLMMSAEPVTVGRCGYPDLLQTGESCGEAALHDRQHPHDLFMEAGVDYRREIVPALAIQFYGAPVGEPALGPVAFPHRPSAMFNPLAPVAHHWLDATHISFGVATAGIYGRRWKVEGSAFNGREPDDHRYGVDLAALDSVSGRIWWLPSPGWSLQASTGRLRDAEEHDGVLVDVQRTTASAMYHRVRAGRMWASTFAWGRNVADGRATHAALGETAIDVTTRDTIFGRAEVVGKTAHELALADGADVFTIGKLQAGYERRLVTRRGVELGVGALAGVGMIPSSLHAAYGTSTPLEGSVFLRLGPARATVGDTEK